MTTSAATTTCPRRSWPAKTSKTGPPSKRTRTPRQSVNAAVVDAAVHVTTAAASPTPGGLSEPATAGGGNPATASPDGFTTQGFHHDAPPEGTRIAAAEVSASTRPRPGT